MNRGGDLRSPPPFLTMKIPFIICLLISLPILAAEDDGDWEFLNRHIAKADWVNEIMRKQERTTAFRFVPAALKFIEGAEKITVFEGMPHQLFEKELLVRELEKAEETIIGTYPFYPQSQDFMAKDEPALRDLLLDAKGFGPFLLSKMCGGFHPDYAIRFTKGEEHCYLLICFGCGDAQIHHNDKVIQCHLYAGWRELLAGYAKHRPKPAK